MAVKDLLVDPITDQLLPATVDVLPGALALGRYRAAAFGVVLLVQLRDDCLSQLLL